MGVEPIRVVVTTMEQNRLRRFTTSQANVSKHKFSSYDRQESEEMQIFFI